VFVCADTCTVERLNNDNEKTNIGNDLFWQRTLNSLDEALY